MESHHMSRVTLSARNLGVPMIRFALLAAALLLAACR